MSAGGVAQLAAAHEVDGARVLEHLLLRDAAVDLFSRQILVAWDPARPERRWSFVQGIPEESTLSGVTFAQDKRISRALLQRSGLATTKAATFSFRGADDAVAYARRVGWPVRVSLAVDHGARAPGRVAWTPRQLRSSLADLRRVGEDATAAATNDRRAAYALTGLLEHEEDEAGSELWAPSTRYLVERVGRRDREIHVLIASGAVRGAISVRRPHTARATTEAIEPSAVPPALSTLAAAAAEAVPGLAVARVVLVAPKLGHAATPPGARVRDVSERPRLDLFEQARPGWGRDLSAAWVPTALPARRGPEEVGRFTLEVDGLLEPRGLESSAGTGLTVEVTSTSAGCLTASLTGTPAAASAWLTGLLAGRAVGAHPRGVSLRPG